MKANTGSLLLALALSLTGCGQALESVDNEGVAEEGVPDDEVTVHAQAACYAYLLDNPNFSGPLPPFPVVAAPGVCVNLPLASQNRTSSFRLSGCKVRFYDGVNCTGAAFGALTSGAMPPAFDNRASSLRFF